ncbi:protein of unknown function [Methylocella tundrae]|uniref:Uncharacterized protein n=1 Tax=Methylocella tundrae TaxID=227605 RepID=A0A4V6IM47_METTU|nr:protein of unknown function [Methylocella tundrae]
MSATGGFLPVRSRACNLVSGHSVYGVAGPGAEWQFSGDRKRKRSFDGTSQTAEFLP